MNRFHAIFLPWRWHCFKHTAVIYATYANDTSIEHALTSTGHAQNYSLLLSKYTHIHTWSYHPNLGLPSNHLPDSTRKLYRSLWRYAHHSSSKQAKLNLHSIFSIYCQSAFLKKNGVTTYKTSLGSPRLLQYKSCNTWHTQQSPTRHSTRLSTKTLRISVW